MMGIPFFSIIIPVFRVEDYLPQCVDMVLSQTFRDFEVILVDDGSPDKCPELCDDYALRDNRVKVVHKKNGGSSDARNEGIRQSSGTVILFLDSDDYYSNELFLEKVHSTFLKDNPEVVIYGCMVRDLISGKERISRGNYDEKLLFGGEKEQLLIHLFECGQFPGAAWVMAVKRSIIKKIGLQFPLGVTAEDFYWVANVLHTAKKIVFENNAFYVYNINRGESVTTRPRVSGIKGVVLCVNDWLGKQPREQGITNFMAHTCLLALKSYAGLERKERLSVKEDLLRCSKILNMTTGLNFRISLLLLDLIGPFFAGKFMNLMYNIFSKR